MAFFEFSDVLNQTTPVFLFLGVIFMTIFYKKLDALHKGIYFYLILMLVVEITSRILEIYGNNLIVLLIYSLIEAIYITYIYFKYLFKNKYKLLFIICLVAVVYIICELVYYTFFNTSIKSFQPYSKVVDNFIVILLALSFLQEKIVDFKEQKWDNFTLNIVILVFFTFNTLIFLPINFLVNEGSGVKFYFWAGNSILLLLFYSYLIAKVWKNGRQSKLIKK